MPFAQQEKICVIREICGFFPSRTYFGARNSTNPCYTADMVSDSTLTALRTAVTDAVHNTAGTLSGAERAAIYAAAQAGAVDPDVPEDLRAFVDKVIHSAYKTTDRDVALLLANGHSEDAIYEAIVTAAAGAGMRRIDAGLRAMRPKTTS